MEIEMNFLKSILKKGDVVVIACSGGPDSMCLLSLVNEIKEEYNLQIICAHVNHKLRKESDTEAQMVTEFAQKNNIQFELLELNEYLTSNFSEQEARNKRYNFFFEVMDKYNSNILMTAHHGDDLIETILMRLTRGSNLSGYIGIPKVSINKNKQIIRPLLTTTKKDILNYVIDNNIPYSIDKSNNSLKYTRNRYRKTILPFLKLENPQVHKKYLKFSEELIEYDNFVKEYITNNKLILDKRIVIDKVNKESNFIKKKCIEVIVKYIQENDYFDITDAQVQEIFKIIDKPSKSINLNNNYQAINDGKYLKIVKETTFEETIFNKDIVIGNYMFYYNTKEGDNSNSCIYLNSLDITLPLKFRPWQEGDKMQVKNLNGTKKLSDIFINSKVLKAERKNIPILVDSKNNILWIPNIKKSQFAKDKSEKYDIIIKCEAR